MKSLPRTRDYLPFYLFISALIGLVGFFQIQNILLSGQIGLALLAGVVLGSHIGLYWLNVRWNERPLWSYLYTLIQGVILILVLALPFGSQAISTLGIALIGEAVGVWGNTRQSLWRVAFYLGLLAAGVWFLAPDEFSSILYFVLTNGSFIVIIMLLFNQSIRERQRALELAESLESANAALAASAARIEDLTRQAERERLARELHDTLVQGVAGLTMRLEAIKNLGRQGDHAQLLTQIDQALLRARGTLREARAAIHDLRFASDNFESELSSMLEGFAHTEGLELAWHYRLEPEMVLLPAAQHQILRALSEALENVRKHASATCITVALDRNGGDLELVVEDDGAGFDPAAPLESGHYGLAGMAERAGSLGGSLVVESQPGMGTRLVFSLPLSQEGAGV